MTIASYSNYRRDNFMDSQVLKRRVRYILGFFVFGLVISGLTAFPIRWEIGILESFIGEGTFMEKLYPPMAHWISFVQRGLTDIPVESGFIYYGTDCVCSYCYRDSFRGAVAGSGQEYLGH